MKPEFGIKELQEFRIRSNVPIFPKNQVSG